MPTKATPGYVYFIQARCASKLIKIGWTINSPADRLGHLQVGSPVPLVGRAFMRGERRLEFELHERFCEHCSHGEWFRPVPELLDFMRQHATRWPRRFGKDEGAPLLVYRKLSFRDPSQRGEKEKCCSVCSRRFGRSLSYLYVAGRKRGQHHLCRRCCGDSLGMPLAILELPEPDRLPSADSGSRHLGASAPAP